MPTSKSFIKIPKTKIPYPFSKKNGKNRVNATIKTIVVYILIGLAVLILMGGFSGNTQTGSEIPLSQVISEIKEDKIEKISLEGEKVKVDYRGEEKDAISRKEAGESIYKVLESAGVDPSKVSIEITDISWKENWVSVIGTVLPILLMVAFFFFIFRQAKDGAQGIFSFGQSRARLFTKDQPQIKFSDVAGVDEAKKELEEVVDFLKNPGKYKEIGARTPKGVLLVGPPGTGKTLLSRAIAGEASVPFYSIAGSEFMEMLVGVGASVIGDTPVLIKDGQAIKLLPIGEFVDLFYQKSEQGIVKRVENIQTLGFERKQTDFRGGRKGQMLMFKNSAWKKVEAVYRHKVNEIHEIEYLGGKISTTPDHSVFVRQSGRIIPKKVSELRIGDLLVELPMNIRHWDSQNRKTMHEIKAHKFDTYGEDIYLDFWDQDQFLKQKYDHILQNLGKLSSYQLAASVGVSQTTVLNWQKGVHLPQKLSRKLVKLTLPEQVLVTTKLMKILGYYTAEGRGTNNLEFTFGTHEPEVFGDCIDLMEDVFGIKPVLVESQDHAVKVKYYSAHLGRFFTRFCGNGSHNKHTPQILWQLPKEYFLAYLEGYSKGDGYITKTGKLSMSSVSHRLIQELAWLCSMHGIKVGIKHEFVKGGRVIKSKPLPDGECWTLIIGRTSNPFLPLSQYPSQFKRAIVKKITKKTFNGYVYDLCGVENEAFFGGEKPVLLHNSRVRDMFATAKKSAPAIIFIDEIESIGRMRGMGMSGGHDEREQTLNQILVEMDGFAPNESVIVIAATNRPDLLDPALIRPGRFDRRVLINLPDLKEREEIIKLHMKGKPFTKDVDIERLARRTVGFSGADLANMLNEAAILAARDAKKEISPVDLEEAATKVKMGPQRRRLQSDRDRNLAAYHEGGHAVVGHSLPLVDPVHRISIVSRGMSGGHTMFPPTEDRSNETKSRLLQQIATALGGRAAEEIIFDDVSTGATNDLQVASSIAREMVTQYGMSELGNINIKPTSMFGAWRGEEGESISESLQARVDDETKKIIDKAYKLAKELLIKNRTRLDKVAKALLDKETLDTDEFEKIVGKKKTAV